ncbi:MAG TPA: Chromate resistance protein ChrB [Dehalococcoidales bacterium]|nr:Chromate resistance protein ChrB [Dehalococcoidales bacterium]
MDWLLFTYWLPAEPSRKRVFIWRQLKKLGALSVEGAGWLLPKAEPFATKIKDILNSVEEMEGTANLYIVADFSETQEQRAIARFKQKREREYAEIIKECHKMLHHIERERQQQEINFEEVQELEGDLGKINRWLSEAKERDFWDIAAREEVQKLINEAETGLNIFTQETYERIQNLGPENGTNAGV